MRIFKKDIKNVLLCMFIAAVIIFMVVLVKPGYARMNTGSVRTWSGSWLSQFEGQNVRVTFVSVPSYLGTNLGQISALQLIEAGQAGVVVGFRPSRTVFIPYSQITSIEPIYR
jgi:hypothetical protein